VSRLDSARWRWAVRLAAGAGIAALWWFTATEDADWALWRRYGSSMAAVNMVASVALLEAAYLLGSRDGIRRRLVEMALLNASLGLTLALLEVPALAGHDYGRTFGVRGDDTWNQLAAGVNLRDDELIHVHKPHTRYRGRVVGNLVGLGIPDPVWRDVDIAYDHHGFRNDQDLTRADVVAIGDSFVEGAETVRARVVDAELSRRLGVPVVNFGQSGYGPQQELVVLERYAKPLSPKVVVWFFFGGNDLDDAESYDWRRSHLDELLTPPLGSRTFARNALAALARLTTPVRHQASATAVRHTFTYTRGDGQVETMYLDREESAVSPLQWDLVTATLGRAQDATRTIGADLLVVFIPRKLRVYRGHLRAAPDSFAATWSMNDLPETLGRWCQERGIGFLDSTAALRAAVASGTSVYFPDDVHGNAVGHGVVAEAVSRQIEAGGRLHAVVAGGGR
jgi:lysophospholipase L1-like esterase